MVESWNVLGDVSIFLGSLRLSVMETSNLTNARMDVITTLGITIVFQHPHLGLLNGLAIRILLIQHQIVLILTPSGTQNVVGWKKNIKNQALLFGK